MEQTTTLPKQRIVHLGHICPNPSKGLELYTPYGTDGNYSKWIHVGLTWTHTDGEYRKDAVTGRFRVIPHRIWMNGYTRTRYNNWLKREGFAV